MPSHPPLRTWPARLRRVALPVRAMCAGLLGVSTLWACSQERTRLTDEEIERASARADSMLAEVDRAPLLLDSLRLAMQRQFDSAMLVTSSDAGTLAAAGAGTGPDRSAAADRTPESVGQEMSRRAQARGDSIARAMAQRLANLDANGNRSRGDSLRGVLAWQGTEPARAVVLRQGDQMVTLSGMATSGLSRLVGTEVTVFGVKITPRDIVVSDFVVRGADGVPAYDGVLESDGTLRLSDGSGARRVPVPEALRGFTGTRVWVAVKDGHATGYGVIRR